MTSIWFEFESCTAADFASAAKRLMIGHDGVAIAYLAWFTDNKPNPSPVGPVFSGNGYLTTSKTTPKAEVLSINPGFALHTILLELSSHHLTKGLCGRIDRHVLRFRSSHSFGERPLRTHRYLNKHELGEIIQSRDECLDRLEISTAQDAESVLAALEESIRVACRNRSNYTDDWITDIAIMIGSAWGSILEHHLKWRWIFIENDPEGVNGYALTTLDEDYAIHPMSYAREAIYVPADLTLLLSFNLLHQELVAPGTPGSLENLMPQIAHIVPSN